MYCDNLATTLSQPCDSFKIQGCAKVVKKHCGNAKVVTTLSFLYGENLYKKQSKLKEKLSVAVSRVASDLSRSQVTT